MSKEISFSELVSHVDQCLLDVRVFEHQNIVIGYSGGLDSSILIHAMLAASSNTKLNITAVHCHHGLSPNADQWAAHCQNTANSLDLKVDVHYLDLDGKRSEQAAREARYKVFAEYMQQGSILLLGHQADDQIETMLFRLFRGTGLKGLAAIPFKREFDGGLIIRPLLDIQKENLKEIAIQESISWIEDESNNSDVYDRNMLRNKVLPLLKERWPNVDKSLLKTRKIIEDSGLLLNEYADNLIKTLACRAEAFGSSICLVLLSELTRQQVDLVLRRLLLTLLENEVDGVRGINESDLEQIRSQFLNSSLDAQPKIEILNCTLRRFRSRLYFLIDLPEKNSNIEPIDWNSANPLDIAIEGQKLGCLSLIEGKDRLFQIGFRGGNERLKPVVRNHSQSLKKLLQESDIAPWLRPLLPIVYLNNEVVAVADIFPCAEHRFKWQWHSD